jgi:hypothetical protein
MKTIFSFAQRALGIGVFLMLCFPMFTHAQSDIRKASISEKLAQFFQATQEKNWEQVLDLTYPKLFELVPREQMLGLFQGMESEGMSFEMGDMVIKDIYGVEDFEGETFTAVDYGLRMDIRLSGENFNDQALGFMQVSFETTYGADNVRLDKENKTFIIQAEKTLFAIADEGTENWHFIEKNAEQTAILEQLIAAEVLEKFE